jgi:hypothetical protein
MSESERLSANGVKASGCRGPTPFVTQGAERYARRAPSPSDCSFAQAMSA